MDYKLFAMNVISQQNRFAMIATKIITNKKRPEQLSPGQLAIGR
jgi:hypothetical protein